MAFSRDLSDIAAGEPASATGLQAHLQAIMTQLNALGEDAGSGAGALSSSLSISSSMIEDGAVTADKIDLGVDYEPQDATDPASKGYVQTVLSGLTITTTGFGARSRLDSEGNNIIPDQYSKVSHTASVYQAATDGLLVVRVKPELTPEFCANEYGRLTIWTGSAVTIGTDTLKWPAANTSVSPVYDASLPGEDYCVYDVFHKNMWHTAMIPVIKDHYFRVSAWIAYTGNGARGNVKDGVERFITTNIVFITLNGADRPVKQ